jgi:general secretion pathway protein L
MSEWLLLKVPRDPAQAPAWIITDARGQLLAAPGQATGAELSAAAHGRRVALIVSGADVLQLVAPLPAGNEARLQQLAPFALEDQVSEDVDSLHFAVGGRDGVTGTAPVLVVARRLLDEWLAQAREWNLVPEAIYADSDLAPVLPGHLAITVDGDHLVLRREGERPVVLPSADPRFALEMLLGADATMETLHAVVYAAPDGWRQHAAEFEALRPHLASMKVQLSSGGVLPLLAPGLADRARINLLQGGYRPRQQGTGGWQRWRVAAALGAALLLLHSGAQWWELRRLRTTERQLDTAIEQVAAMALPGEPLGGDLRKRMEERLARGSGGGNGEGELMHLLAAVAAAHDNVPVTRVDSLNFKPGEMQLRVTGPDATSLEKLSEALRASGYTAQVTSGTAQGTGFQGRVELKAPGT